MHSIGYTESLNHIQEGFPTALCVFTEATGPQALQFGGDAKPIKLLQITRKFGLSINYRPGNINKREGYTKFMYVASERAYV